MSNNNESTAGVYVYEDPKTGELFHYSRRGTYRKNGRSLVFKGRSHILDRIEQNLDKKQNKN
tara:strand:+ start:300 stop:485 length:186 start_codon:yes stop_codon:yes gene_type:complete